MAINSTIWILEERPLPIGHGGVPISALERAANLAGFFWKKTTANGLTDSQTGILPGDVLASGYGANYPMGMELSLIELQRRGVHLLLLGDHPLSQRYECQASRTWAPVRNHKDLFNMAFCSAINPFLERLHLLNSPLDSNRCAAMTEALELSASFLELMPDFPRRFRRTGLGCELYAGHPADRRVALVYNVTSDPMPYRIVPAALLEHRCPEFSGARIVWATCGHSGSPLSGWVLADRLLAGLLRAARDGLPHVAPEDADTCPRAWTPGASATRRPRIEVKHYHNRPTLWLDGQPTLAHTYMFDPTGACLVRDIPRMAATGIHMYSFMAPLVGSWKESVYSFEQFDALAERILAADPEAWLLPRVFIQPPGWWLDKHPGELTTFETGSNELDAPAQRILTAPNPSLASELWRQEACDLLTAFARHASSAPYGHRWLGTVIASGPCGEWTMWGHADNFRLLGDESEPMQRAFRRWLRGAYRDNVAALRTAWKQEHLDFETLRIPDPADRFQTMLGALYDDPARLRRVMDYRRFLNELGADLLIAFCRAVKAGAAGNALAGALFAYNFEPWWNELCAEHALTHHAAHRILDAPEVDFFSTPMSYSYRRLETGDGAFHGIPDSVRLHGKLWFGENDTRTWLAGKPGANWYGPDTKEESQAILLRDFGICLTKKTDWWWYDFGRSWYNSPELLATLRRCDEVARRALHQPRAFTAPVAVLMNNASLHATVPISLVPHRALNTMRMRHLPRMGTPWQAYLIDDLEAMPSFRLYVFAWAACLSAKDREAIRRLQRDGNILLWLYAPGVITDHGLDLEAATELTGMRLAMERHPRKLEIRITDEAHPYMAGANDPNLEFGLAIREPESRPDPNTAYDDMQPVFWVDDPRARTLGVLRDSGEPALCVRAFESWTSVFSASPVVPWPVLRNVARAAGAHLYLDTGDVVHADGRFVFVSTGKESRPRTIQLPATAPCVVEIMSGAVASTGPCREFVWPMQARRTYAFDTNPQT